MPYLRKLQLFSAIAVLILALWPQASWGQTVYGSIAGTVLDPTGAAIPGTTVTLTNIGTATKQTMNSDAAGSYTFVNILPGDYRIEAEKAGFKKFKREPITVLVGSALRIDVPLEVGAVSQTIEVAAKTPLLQAQSSDLGQVVEARTVTEMPLNGRNVISLVQLSPGVQPQGPPAQGNGSMNNPVGANPFGAGDFQVGGSQAGQNAVFVDGVPTNGSYLNVITLIPTQDSIQEFKVQTNSMEADYGRFAGGIINMSTKSGSNTWHGGAWEFLRNKVLDANNFFANRAGTPVGPWTQNQFGGDLGGKVIRDKLFVFSSYEGYRVRSSQVLSNGIVPTAAERNGDFSALGYNIYDPLTGPTCTSSGGTCRTQIGLEPGGSGTPNVIAPSQINPASKVLLGYYPLPNASNGQYNFVTSYGTGGDTDQANERVDYNVSSKQRFFARFTYYKLLNLPDTPFKDICTDRCTETVNTKQIALGDTYTLSPTTILDLHLGYTRYHYVRTPLTSGFDVSSLGPAWGTYQFQSTPLPIPCINQNPGDGLLGSGFCSAGTGSEIGAGDDTWSFLPSLSKIKGRHTLKMGYEFRLLRNNYYQTNQPAGLYQFDRLMTAANPVSSGTIDTGNGFASFLLGYGANNNGGAVVTPSLMAPQIVYHAMYIQDTLQATKKLTLNLGLRYDIQGGWTERFNRIAVWNPTEASPLAGQTSPVTGAVVPSSLKSAFDLVASSQRSSRAEINTPWTEFNPRIGLAYRLAPKTVIRAGYGIFYLPNDVAWNNAPHNLAMNTANTAWYATANNSGYFPLNNFSNPFPNGITQPPGRNATLVNTIVNGPSYAVANNPPAYTQEWNFNIQHELRDGTLIDLAYAGSKGTHLPMHNQDYDQLPDQYLPAPDGSAGPSGYTIADLKASVPNPYAGLVSGGLTGATIPFAQTLLPYPQYTDVSIAEPNDRDSIYHSFQMKIQKRFSHGGTILASYTISKLISNTNNEINWLGDAAPNWGDTDAYNLKNERSLDGFDVPQRFVLGFVLDAPFGNGKKFANSLSPVANKFVSGWGIDGILTLQSGFPLNISGGSNALCNAGIQNLGGCRITRIGKDSMTSGSTTARLAEWFDTSAFTNTTDYTRGNGSRVEPSLRMDGMKNMDFAIFKNTKFGPDEKLGLEFRTEFFNFFNTPQFAAPNASCCSSTNSNFGVVSSQYNLPRLIQFALRLSF